MFNPAIMLDMSSGAKRSKITKACDNCRRRRVKCDGVPDGCGGCKAAKTQCVYTTSNTKRGPPKGYVEVIEDRLGKIESMLAGIIKKKVLVPRDTPDTATASQSEAEDNDIDNDNDNDDDRTSIYSTDLVEVKKQPPASPTMRAILARSSTPVARGARSGSATVASVARHSPLVSRNRSLTALLPFSQDSIQHQLATQQDYPGPVSEADMAALVNMFDKLGTTSVRTTVPFPWLTPEQSRQYGRNHLQFSAQSLEPPLPLLSCPSSPSIAPNVTLNLLNVFFDHFNTFLPIIHKSTFMKQWQRQFCQLCSLTSTSSTSSKNRPKDADAHTEHIEDAVAPLSPLLLNALLAVASRIPTKSKQGAEMVSMSQEFFDAARLLLDDFLDVPRVSTVQALCLMSQFHHQGEWKTTRSSGYLSMGIRMANELGLNRDPAMFGECEADALRCLWWSMFILDHQFSAWLGLGLSMHDKESNVELPMGVSSSQQDLRGFVCMIRLVKILGTVLQHSYSTQSLPPQFGGHDSMVSFIEGSLTSWLSNLSPDMRWQNPNLPGILRGSPALSMRSMRQQSLALARECSEIYPAYLYIVYNTTLILLHRPYIVGAAGSPTAAQSNTICTGSGRAITDIAQSLDIEQCSYVVNRFALYALLQAGVIHAMNAVYDKRGSEVAMDYYKRTLSVLQGFLVCTTYSGGVAEGIKILEQFLASTSMAAAEDEAQNGSQGSSGTNETEQNEGQLNHKKRQLGALSTPPNICSFSQDTTPFITTSSTTLTQSVVLTPTTMSMMISPELTNGGAQSLYSAPQQRPLDLKEQQKQQQLKIQQQQRMYQQMQTFGPDAVKAESIAEINVQNLEQQQQQQQQQQQLLKQQLQRQQQKQQVELELKEQSGASSHAPSATAPVPVIPSHRYAMQMLQQQQHYQQANQGHGNVTIPMTMTMATMTMEAQSKLNHQDFQMSDDMATSTATYDFTQFWADPSAVDQQMTPSFSGTINPAGLEQNGHRISTMSENQNQFGGGAPIWM